MTFPVNGILDSGVRADEDPLSNGGAWTTGIQSGDVALKIVSNKIVVNTGNAQSYWNTSFNADQEVFLTLTTIADGANYQNLWVRIQNPGGGSLNGYAVNIHGSAPATFDIYKCVSGTLTLLSSPTASLANGDSIGFDVIGTTVTCYRKTGGTWSTVGSVVNGDVTGTGYIGIGSNTAVFAGNDFGGGNSSTSAGLGLSLLGIGR